MPWQVRNNRKERPVADPTTGIVLRGTVKLSNQQIAELDKNPVISAMLGIDGNGVPHGSPLMTVIEIDDKGKPVKADPPAPAPEE